jgi:Fe-Mn family superoxide dismutase
MPTTRDRYVERKFDLGNLRGISREQVEAHLELYAGYVKNVNLLNTELAELARAGASGDPKWAELKRHFGFEYNGMRLHELYFENLSADAPGLNRCTQLSAALTEAFSSVDAWRREFVDVGKIRGVGWAVLYQDPETGRLTNHWISLHEEGTLAGFRPLLVMDVWEHAFMVDYKVTERAKYIDAFLENVNWPVCEERFRRQ